MIRKKSNAVVEKLTDKVLVSTPDLLSYVNKRSILLPNPIDTEHFNEKPNRKPGERVFTISTE